MAEIDPPARRDAPRAGRRRAIANLAAVLLTLALSAFALRGVHPGQAWRALRSSDPWWLVPALGAFAAANAARALRWRSLFAAERRPRIGAVADAMLIGYLFNNLLPARAGEAARVLTLTRRGDVPAAEVLGTVLVERVFDLLVLLVVFFVAQPWLPRVSWFHAAALTAAILASGVAAVVVVLAVFGDRPLRRVARLPVLARLPLAGHRLETLVTELAHGLSGLRRPRSGIGGLAWTAVAWLLTALTAFLAMRAFPSLHAGFGAGLLVTVAVGLSMVLPAAPASLGVFEAATLLALQAYGVSHTRALPYALVLHAVNFVPFVVVGLALVHHNARHPPRARAAARSAPALPVAWGSQARS